MVLGHSGEAVPDGHGARVFVRPCERVISPQQNGLPGTEGARDTGSVGEAQVRIRLHSENGETMHVEMPPQPLP